MGEQPIVIVDTYRHAVEWDESDHPELSYKGLRMHALPSLHKEIGNLCCKYFQTGDRLLDLASGSGALSLRLKDLGFRPTAADYVSENFRLPDVPFHQLDLNGAFSHHLSKDSPFDGIIAAEIIEHLENPYHFTRQCASTIKPGGLLIITTPNLQNLPSIAHFLWNGEASYFGKSNIQGDGHISPLTQWQLKLAAERAGFSILQESSVGALHSSINASPRTCAKVLLEYVLRAATRVPAKLRREVFILVARKDN